METYKIFPQSLSYTHEINEIDYENRLEACQGTPLINPEEIPFRISKFSFRPDQEIYVLRDDYLCGGSKARVGYNFIKSLVEKGYQRFVYVSPWYGAAQLALPWLLKLISKEVHVDLQAIIFISY